MCHIPIFKNKFNKLILNIKLKREIKYTFIDNN